MKTYSILLLLIASQFVFSQSNTDALKSEVYAQYREDQFYAAVTYNLLNNKPSSVSQTGFSSGFHFGTIRDMPINKRRNLAIGLGLGLSSNSFNQNILVNQLNTETLYNIIDESVVNVTKNKFTTYIAELPLELRWRTSTATDYSFWRIYTGFKLGYLVYNSTKYKSDSGNVNLSNVTDFNRLQYGLTLTAGYGTWNFHLYYGINSIFNSNAKIDGVAIDVKAFKMGLLFYIL